MTKKLNPLEEASQYYWQNFRKMMQTRASRRLVIRAGTLATLGGMGALSEILAACSRRPTEEAKPGVATSVSGAPTTTASTEDPLKGLKMPSEIAKVGELLKGKYKWSRYPLVEFFNWRKLPWDTPPTRGGTIMRLGSAPPHWDLMRTETSTQFNYMMNGLLYPDMGPGANLDSQPIALDLPEKMDHTPDYNTWLFKIPQGVKFHNIAPVNGRECTAEDVVYSFQRYMDTSLWGIPLAFVDKVSAPDKYTVRFDMKKPIAFLPAILALPYYMVFAREHFEGDKDFWNNQVIGTGAYTLTYYKYRETMESTRFPDYFQKDKKGIQLPYADKVVAPYFADATARKAAFRSGNLDNYAIEPASVTDGDDILKSNPNTFLAINPHWAVTHIRVFFQYNNKLFQDVRVRRALSMALDRRKIVEQALGGAGTAASYPIPYDLQGLKDIPDLEELGPYYQYNPKEAKRLLEEAGYPNGFSVKLMLSVGSAYLDTYLMVQKYWRDIGVRMETDEQDYLVYLNALQKKTFPDLIMPGNVLGLDADQVIYPLYYPGSPQNWGNVDDPTLTGLLDKLRNSLDPDERTRTTGEISKRIADQAHHLYVAGFHILHHSQPWVHTIANSLYTTIINYGSANWRTVFVDETAPGGRGGKKI